MPDVPAPDYPYRSYCRVFASGIGYWPGRTGVGSNNPAFTPNAGDRARQKTFLFIQVSILPDSDSRDCS